MNRRVAVAASAVLLGATALTGCGSLGHGTPHGIVVEREEKLNKHGGVDYSVEVATDSKTNRTHKVTKKTKTSEVNVSGINYKNCGLGEYFPNCK